MNKAFQGFVAGVIAVLLLAGCQSVKYLPQPKNPESTLLIIPLEFTDNSREAFNIVFSLNYDHVNDSRTQDLVDFSKDYAFIKTLPEGKHVITRLLARWKETGQIIAQWEMNVPFELAAGEATILPYRFSVKVDSKYFHFTSYNLMSDQLQEIENDINSFENAGYWKVNATTGK